MKMPSLTNKLLAALSLAPLLAGLPTAGLTQAADPPPPDQIGGYSLGPAGGFADLPLTQRPFVFRNMEELTPYPVNLVRHGDYLRPLPNGPSIDVNVVIDGHRENIDSFMQRYHTAGLLVIKDGKVRVERYRYGNTARSRWNMQSITKSLVSTALGAAIQEGKIGSVDDQIVKYVPDLKGSAYDGDTIRHLLNMTSGVDRADVYDQPSSVMDAATEAYFSPDPQAVFQYLRSLKRKAPPGTWFAYDGMDTFVLGEVVRRAAGTSLANYISQKIWTPGGMEEDALMRTTVGGLEVGHGGWSATLRDVGRFGLFAMDGGLENGKQIVPAGWFDTLARGETDPKHIRAPGNTSVPGYGYTFQWWNIPRGGATYELGDDGGFAGLGAYGQQLIVVPKQKLVVVIQSSDFKATSSVWLPGRALATAIAQQLR